MKTSKTATMKASVLFEDARFANVAITWAVGSNTLMLCSKGGPQGGAVVLRKTTIKGTKSPDWEMAQAEASKWFDSLGVFYDEEPASGEWVE